MRLRAPAKLNLGLRVVGRRDDGYHDIASWFVPLELADEVEVESRPAARASLALEIEGSAAGVPGDESNLGARAARAFLEAAGLEAEVRIRLGKRVPAAAGLGGGSSDAAAVLCALAELHPGRLAPAELARLALTLGADVPFFLDPRPARVSGIGDHIEPLAGGLPPLDLLLARPDARYSTADVYRGWDEHPGDPRPGGPEASLTPSGAAPSLHGLSALLGDAGPEAGALTGLLRNDLEPAATRLCPVIAGLREALAAAGARGVGMSGSGPTMYGIFEDEAAVRTAHELLAAEKVAADAWVAITRTAAGR